MLPLNVPTTFKLDDRASLTMSVTLYDANHCPGSVMVLLDGYFGRVLHTGDFRFSESMLEIPAIRRIDHLILDNTYASPKHVFPPREQVREDILQCIEDHGLENLPVYIGIDTLGKEELLLFLAERLGLLVGVDERRYRALQLIDVDMSYFTYDLDEADIIVVTRQEVSMECPVSTLPGTPSRLYILPTSLTAILPVGNRSVSVRILCCVWLEFWCILVCFCRFLSFFVTFYWGTSRFPRVFVLFCSNFQPNFLFSDHFLAALPQVSSDTFESVIRDVNEILREAEDLGSANTLESVLGFATCFVSYAFITTHYEKCLVRVRARISRANDELFRPSGLYMKDPSLNGMLHIELIIL